MRTTAFKTVRIDELTLQSRGITVETVDLADVFARARSLKEDDAKMSAKAAVLRNYTSGKLCRSSVRESRPPGGGDRRHCR